MDVSQNSNILDSAKGRKKKKERTIKQPDLQQLNFKTSKVQNIKDLLFEPTF